MTSFQCSEGMTRGHRTAGAALRISLFMNACLKLCNLKLYAEMLRYFDMKNFSCFSEILNLKDSDSVFVFNPHALFIHAAVS